MQQWYLIFWFYGIFIRFICKQGEDSVEYFLGLTPSGIIVLRNKSTVAHYYWPRIAKVYFKGRFFMLRVCDKNVRCNIKNLIKSEYTRADITVIKIAKLSPERPQFMSVELRFGVLTINLRNINLNFTERSQHVWLRNAQKDCLQTFMEMLCRASRLFPINTCVSVASSRCNRLLHTGFSLPLQVY